MSEPQAPIDYTPVCRIYRTNSRVMVEIDERARASEEYMAQFMEAVQDIISKKLGEFGDLHVMSIGQDGSAKPVMLHGVKCHNGTGSEKPMLTEIIRASETLEEAGWIVRSVYRLNGRPGPVRLILD